MIYHMNSAILFIAIPDTQYQLVPVRPLPQRKPGQSIRDQILDMPSKDITGPARIVGNGKRKHKKHIANHPDLFRKFADIRTVGALLDFIREFGRLTDEAEGDDVLFLLLEAKAMRGALKYVDKRNRAFPASISDLKATLIVNARTGRIEKRILPQTLLQALWLQFVYAPIGVAKLKTCLFCGEQFRAGKGSRRQDAKFCSRKHQIQFNSLARSDPKLREGRI
jgi:hypothetical protein